MAEKQKNIYTVPNQKVITVHKLLSNNKNLYTICNLSANRKAMALLTPNAYRVYMYMCFNQDDYTFALSYEDIKKLTGMSNTTYRKSVKELIEKKYLTQVTGNKYIFNEGAEETTGQSGKNRRTEETTAPVCKKIPDTSDNNYRASQVEITGEILQDNTKYNTLNNTESAPPKDINSFITPDGVATKEKRSFSDISDQECQEMFDKYNSKQSTMEELMEEYNTSRDVVSEALRYILLG